MYSIYRKYGPVIEITEIEKEPSKVRLSNPKPRSDVYGLRRSDNIRRTRQICLRRVLAAIEDFGYPLLVTLTFKGDASDASFANDSLRSFQVRLRTKFPKAQSIFIPELSPRGRIHFHGFLFNVPMHLGDSSKGRRRLQDGTERKERTLAKLWGEGFVDARKTDGSPKLAYYISKYVTKGGGEVLFNAMRLLRISHGFPQEIVIRDQMLVEQLKRQYADKKPFREWKGDHQFLGEVHRKTYRQDIP